MFGSFSEKLFDKVCEIIQILIAVIGFIFVLALQLLFYGGFVALVILIAYFILKWFLGG